jgi:membrane-associated phospholipid phosphatase
MGREGAAGEGRGRFLARAALATTLWGVALVAAFRADRWVYLEVAGAVAEKTGEKTWRYGRPEGGRAPKIVEVLTLFKRMGELWFVIVVTVTILLIAPERRGQVLALCLAIGFAAAVGQGLLKHSIAKLRPDAELSAEDVERFVEGGGQLVARAGRMHNRGHALFRPPFSGRHSGLTFPSGHAALAFASFAVLGAAFPRARWWFLFLACGIAASRVLMGEHFLSDVIAGAGVGYACAHGVLALPRVRRLMAVAA